ncbi:MAG TPA: hypothetical protein VM537_18245 [Anaerolineae bacterium]|nr:hypothetical protein [Anaerolineae bacterium]
MEWAAGLVGLMGVLLGAVVAVGVARLERRWRREDIRAAEKRVRLEERFEPVRAYAGALCELASDAATSMRVWEALKPAENWQGIADIIRDHLESDLKKPEALEPRPAPRFALRDGEAQAWVQRLELLAMEIQDACMSHLKEGTVADEEELQSWVAKADHALDKLLKRMENVLQDLE